MHVSFDWEHSPRAMILGPIKYKDCYIKKLSVGTVSTTCDCTSYDYQFLDVKCNVAYF